MSIINQMLRDLDARGVAAADGMASNAVPVKSRRVNLWMAMLVFLLLAVAGGLGYFLLSGTMHGRTKPAAPVMARREPVSVVATAMSPVHDARHPLTEVDHTERVATPAPAPAALKLPTVMASKMTQTQVKPLMLEQVMPTVAVVAKNEPAVVKKMADLTPEAEAQQYYDDAQALRRAGKSDAAMSKYRFALERNPGMWSARLQLSRLLQESGQVDAALSQLKVGYDQQQDGELAIALARLLANQGRRDEALRWLARGGEKLQPADRALQGALLSQASRYEEAVKAYQRALASDPDQGGWSLGLGLALESLGRVGEAKAAFRNALDRGTFKPEVVKFLHQKIDASGL